jgi:hypothetical protein
MKKVPPAKKGTLQVIEPGEVPVFGRDQLQSFTLRDVDEFGEYEVKFRKHGVGKKVGRRSAEAVVCEEAERLLEAGWSGDKWSLAEHLSNWLTRHYYFGDPDALTMSPAVIYRNKKFTALWQRFHPRRRRLSR